MSVKRRKYSGGGSSRFYRAEFTTPNGRRVRKSTRCTTIKAAKIKEGELREQAESGFVGEIDPKERTRPINDHIDDFIDHLQDTLRRDKDYCRIARSRLKRVASEQGWLFINQVTMASFEEWRARAGKLRVRWQIPKPKTLNQFLDIYKRFMEWARINNRIKRNPLVDCQKATVNHNRFYRRAATPEELTKLLAATDGERRLIYRFLIYTPLRRATLEQLRWSDVTFGDRPWLSVRGEISKSGQYERSPLRKELAVELEEWKKKTGAKSDDLLFSHIPTTEELEEDWTRAGVPYQDKAGNRRLDLHSFRKTAIACMKLAGVPIENAAAVLHHKDIRTTQQHYNEEPDPVTVDAVERMPTI